MKIFARLVSLPNLIILAVILTLLICFNVIKQTIIEPDGYEYINLTKLDGNIIIIKDKSTLTKETWQYVTDDQEYIEILVFSAYLDDRKNDKFVRVIAVGRTRNPRPVWCKLYYKVDDQNTYGTKTIQGNHMVISENWGLKYTARYVLCPIDTTKILPDAVSILMNPDEEPMNILTVIVNSKTPVDWDVFNLPKKVDSIAVCVKPLHNEYNKEIEIMEFIELHRLLGVNHFYFYNHTLGSQVDCLLRNYISEGVITVLDWQLPIISQKEIRTEGIFAALNDCLYRTMWHHSHVLFVDLDEYIMPEQVDTYKELLEHLNTKPKAQTTGSFSVRNAFFYRQWPDDEDIGNLNDELAMKSITLRKTRRKTELNPHRIRSKYIARPEMITMVGNHFIWQYLDRKLGPMNVDPEVALMHHYRVCEFGGDDCVEQSSIVDRRVYTYKDRLLSEIRSKYYKLRDKCQLLEY